MTSLLKDVTNESDEPRNNNQDNIKAKKNKVVVAEPILSIFAVPSADKCSRYSGLFRCSVVAKGAEKYLMYYDGIQGPVILADRQLGLKILPKFYIFDISRVGRGCSVPLNKDSAHYVGKLRRDKDLTVHAFSLHLKRISVRSRLSMYTLCRLDAGKEPPPRKVSVALYHEKSDTTNRGNTLAEAVSASMNKTRSLTQVADVHSGLFTFSNKDPCKKKNGMYSLDFYGRCQVASSANMQIADEHGRVILQLTQCTDNTYNLDFR